jgi:hypothetical protein
MRTRIACVILGSLALAALSMPPATAAWGGHPDGTAHPMVGAIYADRDGDGTILWNEMFCSGSFAGRSKMGTAEVFLTAGHCLAWLPGEGIDTVWVSFDPDPQAGDGIPNGLIRASSFTWDPRFGHDWGNWYDSGIVLLPLGSVPGITPIELPPLGYLDRLKSAGTLKGTRIELVGFGAIPTWHQPGGTQLDLDGVRRTSTSVVVGLTRAYLFLLQNPNATGEGGLCFGDSGSPQFVPGTRMVVSTTSGGNGNCNSYNYDYRLDTRGARQFLGQYLALP